MKAKPQKWAHYDFGRVLRLNPSMNPEAVEFGHLIAYLIERDWESPTARAEHHYNCSMWEKCVLSKLENLKFEEKLMR